MTDKGKDIKINLALAIHIVSLLIFLSAVLILQGSAPLVLIALSAFFIGVHLTILFNSKKIQKEVILYEK